MTEAEWLTCAYPAMMLDLLPEKASERKLRLFSVACCRRLWHLLTDDRSREAVEVAERYADGLAGKVDLRRARSAARSAGCGVTATRAGQPSWDGPSFMAWCAVRETIAAGAREATWTRHWYGTHVPVHIGGSEGWIKEDWAGEGTAQADLLRCLFGYPFRPIRPDPAWRTPNAVTLARSMYESRDFAMMPLLADLLEEVGCPNEVSDHCRGPGPHARGCWVVDAVLEKG